MPKMYQNYSNRVKNFIIDMINSEKKIIVESESKSFDNNLKNNIGTEIFVQKRPFKFKEFENEKERIIQNIKNNQYLNGIYDYDGEKKIKINNEGKSEIKLLKNIFKRNKHNFVSPEKKICISDNYPSIDNSINSFQKNNISEIFNTFFPGKIKKIKNLKSLNSFIDNKQINIRNKNLLLRNTKILSKDIKYNSNNKTINFNKINNILTKHFGNNSEIKKSNKSKINKVNISQYISKNKNMNQRKLKKNQKKINNGNETFNLYHSKLHFKAAEEIAENKYDKKNKNLLLLPNLFKRTKLKEREVFSFSDDDIHGANKEDEFYDSYYYKNPLDDFRERTRYNPNLMKELSKMAFEKEHKRKIFEFKNENDYINQSYKKAIKRTHSLNIKDENEVEINGHIYEKNNQFNLITKKILELCNVISNKSKNNMNSLKVGSGKNMMTKGLSIKNFIKKYNLK